jgi:hypothetical protein
MKLSVRIDDALYERLLDRAYGANLSFSEFIRRVLQGAAEPGGRYLFTANDELIGIALQTFAILSTVADDQAPDAYRRGLDHARQLLDERGLLKKEDGQ